MERGDCSKLRAFLGNEYPEDARQFLNDLEESMQHQGYSPRKKVAMATRWLVGEARGWWETVKGEVNEQFQGDEWGVFKQAFGDVYIPNYAEVADTGRVSKDPIGEGDATREQEDSQPIGRIRDWNKLAGLVLVGGCPAYACFDTGATNSLLSESFVKRMGLQVTRMEDGVDLLFANGSVSQALEVCEDCSIEVGMVRTTSNLMVTPLQNYDVLLGMGWLRTCHAHIDCNKMHVVFRIPGKEEYIYRTMGSVG